MLLRGPQINNMPSKSPVIALLTYTKRSHDLNLLKIVGMELLTDIYRVVFKTFIFMEKMAMLWQYLI